ncbi:thioredoxin-domain-containing protein [Tothia fuscella]|uniref:protein disulfide-isomerase n=1 Tax=Tothia fuscella TaxID=1048955 RepID=A0A9P4U3L7_9PEZI|nr:thioredoxin-domain-containing protein [Tothia fuscella]
MVHSTALVFSAASFFFSLPVNAGLYPKSSAVLSVDAKSYDRLIAKSNHTSIVEFYAPWCGHCKNLQPAYEKAAINLKGLANVAAVDCDDDANKQFCGSMGVQGYPTLKIVRPGKKAGRPVVEDYQGARAAKPIVDAVVEKIPNHVKKIEDKGLVAWLQESNNTAKAVLLTDKGTTSALLRALAIDYLGGVSFAQIRSKENTAVKLFGVEKFPTFLVLPGGEKEAIVYDGDLKKEAMSAFVKKSSGVAPNAAEPAPEPKKKAKKAEKKEPKKESKKADPKPKAASATVEDQVPPTESPDPKVDVPPPVKVAPMILTLEKEADLQRECFSPKSHICILALLPAKENKDDVLSKGTSQALSSLGEVQQKHSKRQSLFPFYSIPPENELGQTVRKNLDLKPSNGIEIIAVNAKRLWWRRFSGSGFMPNDIEEFVDAIRMNEGAKNKLPESLVTEAPAVEEAKQEPESAKEAEPPKPKAKEEPPKPKAEDTPEPEPETRETVPDPKAEDTPEPEPEKKETIPEHGEL